MELINCVKQQTKQTNVQSSVKHQLYCTLQEFIDTTMELRKEIDEQKHQINKFMKEMEQLQHQYDDLNNINNSQQAEIDEQETQLNEQKTAKDELSQLKEEITKNTDKIEEMQTVVTGLISESTIIF